MSTFIEKTVKEFRTINLSDLPFRLDKDEVSFAVNVDFLVDKTIKQRSGSALIEDLAQDVQLFNFPEIRDGVVTEHLIAIGGTKALLFNGTTFDEIATGLTDSAKYGGKGFVGTFVFSNGTELKSFKWTGSAYAVADITDVDAPKGLLWEEFQSCLWGCKDGTENLYFSDVGDPEAWTNTNFIALGAMPTDIKRIGEYLFIGTDRGILKITATGDTAAPYILDHLTGIGVVPNTMQEVKTGYLSCWLVNGDYVVFNQFAKSGSEIEDDLGNKIRPVWDYVDPNDSEICSFVDNQTGKAFYSMRTDFALENQEEVFPDVTNNNIQLVINNEHFGWTFYNLQIKSMASLGSDVYFSDYSGKVYKFDSGLYQDAGNEFLARVITAIYDDGRGDLTKGYRKLWLSSNSKTKTEIKVGFSANYDLLEKFSEDELFYAYGGSWGSVRWGEFLWGGGVHQQLNSSSLDIYGTGLQLFFERTRDNSDMQITNFLFNYYPSSQEVY